MKILQGSLLLIVLLQLCACAQEGELAQKENARNLWISPDRKTVLAIEMCGTGLCGRIVGLSPNRNNDGSAILDRRNESPSQRIQPVCGMKVFRNLQWNAKRRAWEGHIYYPQTGRRDSVRIAAGRFRELLIRSDHDGPHFLGLNWFSRIDTWKAYDGRVTNDCTILDKKSA